MQPSLSSRQSMRFNCLFQMDLKRGGKIRIECSFNGQTAVQVYDGTNGWKLRPFSTACLLNPIRRKQRWHLRRRDLGWSLVDYAAKGRKIELVGMEQVRTATLIR